MRTRKDRIQSIRENPEQSVLIAGAGINGIATFLDLALQGLDVLLVDRGDYCSGTSAASSLLVHGGIRYLENGELRLVGEAVEERNRLLVNARHLVKPLPIVFPIFQYFSGLLNAPLHLAGRLTKPAERGAIVMKIGMMLYAYYTRRQKTVPGHVFRNKQASLKLFPELNPEIVYTGTYYDASMLSPERIAIELVTEAAKNNTQAIPLNYMSLAAAHGDQVTLRDEVTGEQLTVRPKILINASGPWIDRVNRAIGQESRYIGGTKGSHLVVNNPALRAAINGHEFLFENEDGRIVLIYPLLDKVLIGTSDITIDDPDQAVITGEEVQYFLEMVKRVFPTISVTPDQIVYTYSGVRPLPRSKAKTTGQISRDHQIKIDEPGEAVHFPIYSLVGGKWTTHRVFAEQVSNIALNRLGIERKLGTRNYLISGAKGYPSTTEEEGSFLTELVTRSGLKRGRVETLFSRYGMRIREVLEKNREQDDKALEHYPEWSTAEIRFICLTEDVIHLDDFILRRSMIGKLGQVTAEGLGELGRHVGQALGWDRSRTNEEIQRLVVILREKHRMDFNRFIQGD